MGGNHPVEGPEQPALQQLLPDTDCGIDDAVAIMIALASPELQVLGISTVSGNVPLERVTDNVLRLLGASRSCSKLTSPPLPGYYRG